ncbi:hypothetical protein CHU32_08355 [Superficieibacter electus]|uniref:Uncharacterized protein n=1 Tax=Superficieibacter electus TaxID=2022662 RepID=A0A2P5GRE9_9ENTR|nr:DUF2778 domain-containing protein [Superficieibacter electus]POP45812.1 hypothetical protein CHU33_06810 [Superficieibacter electus]POP49118.1 hypothetical protein CHU32_08355 [Superficieibacter electus]
MQGFTVKNGKKDETGVLHLSCKTLGKFPDFPVLKSNMLYSDIPECAYKGNAFLPSGKYGIVDRPSGELKSRALKNLRKSVEHGLNTHYRDEWFGAFHDETKITHLDMMRKK